MIAEVEIRPNVDKRNELLTFGHNRGLAPRDAETRLAVHRLVMGELADALECVEWIGRPGRRTIAAVVR
eukprot:720157-Pleurochrysis_carterae.AAC.1